MEHVEAHTMRLLETIRAGEMKSAAVHFQSGDVLYGRLRPYLNKVFRPTFEGLCSAEFIVLPTSPEFEARYLQFFLNSTPFVSFASHLNTGDRPRIDFEQIGDFPVPLAPLAEQRRIVAAIEEHLSRLDASVAGLERVEALILPYRTAVLKAAYDGELATSSGSRHQRAMQPLGELLDGIQAGKSFKCEERPPADGEVGVVKVSAVTWGEFDEVESKTVGDPIQVDPRYFINQRDLLFSRANTVQLVGACVLVKSQPRALMLSDKILRLVPKPGVSPQWLLICLRSPQGRAAIEQLCTGNQDSMRNIGQDRIRRIPISVGLPSATQELIQEVERRFSVVDAAERSVKDGLAHAARLRQAILKRAFEGRLVPQDPHDEPASVLLERIRASRAAAKTPPKRAQRRA
jgi:type I restriction enzyme S subunit